MSGFFFCRQRSYSRSCWELFNTPERLFHLSMTEDVDKLIKYMHSDSRRLNSQISQEVTLGGDKTDTPTDMLHKEAQVAFKILMTH